LRFLRAWHFASLERGKRKDLTAKFAKTTCAKKAKKPDWDTTPAALSYHLTMKKPARITYDDVRRMGLALPHVKESTSYGTPALKVKGKLLLRLRDDIDSIVLKMPFDRREELMAADPETYSITDHYLEYEWVLVRLSRVSWDALHELLQGAHRAAAAPKRRRV
jgi:hypothetical protein